MDEDERRTQSKSRDIVKPFSAFGQIRKKCPLLWVEVVLCLGTQCGGQRIGCILATVCLLSLVPLCFHSLCTLHGHSECTEQEYALKSSGPTFSRYYLWRENSLPLRWSYDNVPLHNVVGFSKFPIIHASFDPPNNPVSVLLSPLCRWTDRFKRSSCSQRIPDTK